MKRAERLPGEDILDRCAPQLVGADRELARERLERLARLLVRIAIRQVRDEELRADSRDSVFKGKIPPTRPPPA